MSVWCRLGLHRWPEPSGVGYCERGCGALMPRRVTAHGWIRHVEPPTGEPPKGLPPRAGLAVSVASACGHPQQPPTDQEIDGCPEIIVRNCPVCACGLWWNIDQWRKL